MIDPGLPGSWPIEVLRALDKFQQGHLVERPPFFYVARPMFGIWRFTRDVGDRGVLEDLLQIEPEDGPPYGLITSQTCDINEEKPKQPWIQVCPAYRVDTVLKSGRQGHLRRGRLLHMMALDAQDLPEGLCVADFRIEFPVEKSWLVGHTPIEAFSDENGYLRLADRLAKLRGRPAFAPVVSNRIINNLRDSINKLSNMRQREMADSVREFRLQVDGNRLLPASARLIVIFSDGVSREKREAVESWLEDWWQSAQVTPTAQGLPLLANRYATLDDLPARMYAESTLLDFAYLSPADW